MFQPGLFKFLNWPWAFFTKNLNNNFITINFNTRVIKVYLYCTLVKV